MEIIIILVLILLNGVFSMSEIALVSAKKFKLEHAARKGSSNARKALELSGNPTHFLSTVQLGITLIGILTGIFSGERITERLAASLAKIPSVQAYAGSLAVLIIVCIVTFLSIVFGELIPKRIGLLFPERIAAFMAKPMHLLAKISSPFIWLLTSTNNLFMWLFGLRADSEEKITEEEIKAIVQQSAEEGEIQEIEQHIVGRVFALGDRRVAELMTHRMDITWLDVSDTPEQVRKKMSNAPHSLYPVGDGSVDKLVGVVSVKEMFAAMLHGDDFSLRQFVRDPLIVHDSATAYQILEKFRVSKWHYAVVVDEYGSVQGLVSMDDVMDALVGDISDYTQNEYEIVQREDGSWLADAQYPYFELLHRLNLSAEEENKQFNTIAGLILAKMGHIPAVGEYIRWRHYEIEVVDMDGMRIDKVLIKPVEQ